MQTQGHQGRSCAPDVVLVKFDWVLFILNSLVVPGMAVCAHVCVDCVLFMPGVAVCMCVCAPCLCLFNPFCVGSVQNGSVQCMLDARDGGVHEA